MLSSAHLNKAAPVVSAAKLQGRNTRNGNPEDYHDLNEARLS
jgi:hypothetical protein